ncbi:Methyltransferase domain [Seminavis robusta]|uniref:Methyltransferase domain n=1 Tax=Seminavis robusta TaxID=568900 RepID=A0A9N8ELI4_9STRA|nr:Methyltransferase domain [Seminavis robusta]|eukprot:Sro1415_g270760.1 Methyltransferase domain (218) ;mRNA; r:24380-25033
MTIGWYEIVLKDLPPGSTLLDVGIGTAGALIACESLLRAKRLRVVGMDYDDQYIRQAEIAIQKADLTDCIQVVAMDLYDLQTEKGKLPPKLLPPLSDARGSNDRLFDAVYFSGSFSLLPDWTAALMIAASALSPSDGKIYITQTYQKQSSWFWSWWKPWLRYITTIDFGQLVTANRIQEFYRDHANGNGWNLLWHEKIPGNVDNPWQAAYGTCLQVN